MRLFLFTLIVALLCVSLLPTYETATSTRFKSLRRAQRIYQDSENNWCHQQILGSQASVEQLNSELDTYATTFANHFGLTGDYHQYINYATVPDRTSFDECAGPYPTVVDIFFKFPAPTSDFDQYEDYLQNNPLSGLPSVQCASISVVANLPGCSAMGEPTSTPTGVNPTQPPEPTDAPTDAPTTEAPTTEAPTTEAPTTEAPTTEAPTTEAPTTEAPTTEAPTTEAPTTEAPTTEAPTSTPTGANPTQGPTPSGECPAIDFTHDLVDGVISFTPASDAPALNFVDVHVHYSGGQLNYRLSVSPSASPDAPSYEVTLPDGLTGITHYWFTYQTSENVACDTDNYPVSGGNATTQPTPEPPTPDPTSTPTGVNPTQSPPSPENVVCYQEIVGSTDSSYAVVSAALTAWEQKMYQALGLTGPIDQHVGHAQVPDRNSFENGCDGPYQTVADIFVYIQATDETYDQISQQLEAFIAANPIVGSHPSIDCGARSVTTFLPRCGRANPTSTPTGVNPTQPPEPTDAPTTEAPTTEAPTTEAPTSTPTGVNPTQPPDECPTYEDGTYVCKDGVCNKVDITEIGTASCYTTEASCPTSTPTPAA